MLKRRKHSNGRNSEKFVSFSRYLLKLLSRYTRKDKAIAEKRFLGANNTVISTTIFKYFISALTLNGILMIMNEQIH